MANTILVNPTELAQKSNQIIQYKEQHQEVMRKMTNLILNIGEAWQGEAQIAFVTKYQGMQPTFDNFAKALEEFAALMNNVAYDMQTTDENGKNRILSVD